MANPALLGGLLKGFGAAQAQQAQRQFEADQADKARRLSILQAAASNPNLDPSALPGIFQQMEEIYQPGGRGKGGGAGSGGSGGSKSKPIAAASGAGGGETGAAGAGGAAPQASAPPQAQTQSQPQSQPPAPQGFLSRIAGVVDRHLQAGLQGARRGFAGPQEPPNPPLAFLTPEQRGAEAAEISVAQQEQISRFREGVAKQAGLQPGSDAYADYVLTGKLPTQFGEFKLGGYGPAMTVAAAKALHPQAMAAPGVPFDWSSVPSGAYIKFALGTDGMFYASPIAPPQLSPSSVSAQLEAAYQTLQSAEASPAQKQAAVVTIQHYDPSRVRTNTTTHISTITNPDGSTFQVAIPVTNTSTTSAPMPVVPGSETPAGGGGGGRIPAARRSATPPAPPAAIGGGSHAASATPIPGTGGHKGLPAIAQRGVTGAVEMNKLSNTIQQTILQAVPDAAQRNQTTDRIAGFDAALKYNTGFSAGELMDRINNLGAIMEIVGTTAIAQGRISNQQIEILKKHVPSANMTPALILSRAKLAQFVANEVLQTMGSVYGVRIDPLTGQEMPVNEAPGTGGVGGTGSGRSGGGRGGVLTPADIQAIAAHARGGGH